MRCMRIRGQQAGWDKLMMGALRKGQKVYCGKGLVTLEKYCEYHTFW